MNEWNFACQSLLIVTHRQMRIGDEKVSGRKKSREQNYLYTPHYKRTGEKQDGRKTGRATNFGAEQDGREWTSDNVLVFFRTG